MRERGSPRGRDSPKVTGLLPQSSDDPTTLPTVPGGRWCIAASPARVKTTWTPGLARTRGEKQSPIEPLTRCPSTGRLCPQHAQPPPLHCARPQRYTQSPWPAAEPTDEEPGTPRAPPQGSPPSCSTSHTPRRFSAGLECQGGVLGVCDFSPGPRGALEPPGVPAALLLRGHGKGEEVSSVGLEGVGTTAPRPGACKEGGGLSRPGDQDGLGCE